MVVLLMIGAALIAARAHLAESFVADGRVERNRSLHVGDPEADMKGSHKVPFS